MSNQNNTISYAEEQAADRTFRDQARIFKITKQPKLDRYAVWYKHYAGSWCTLHACEIELLALVKFWTHFQLSEAFAPFLFPVYIGAGAFGDNCHHHRIEAVAEVLGDEKVDIARGEALQTYKALTDPILWEAFRNGTHQQQQLVWDHGDKEAQWDDKNFLAKLKKLGEAPNAEKRAVNYFVRNIEELAAAAKAAKELRRKKNLQSEQSHQS